MSVVKNMILRMCHKSITRMKIYLIMFLFCISFFCIDFFSDLNDHQDTYIALGDSLSTESVNFPPKHLQISDISLDTLVEPMGWEIVSEHGNLTTEWILPLDAAGWHTNSAHAGIAGNVILSGHHLRGAKIFNVLSLGWAEVGHQIILTDKIGQSFIYEIVEVTEPILSYRGTPADQERSLSYIAPTEHAQLTLVTGWPSFSTTHRIFVIAKLVQKFNV